MAMLKNVECSNVYSLIKSTLLSEFFSCTPSDLLRELNVYFSYKDTILRAEGDFEEQRKK